MMNFLLFYELKISDKSVTVLNTDSQTISFVILDNIRQTFDPIEVKIDEVDYETVSTAVDAIAKNLGILMINI